MSTHIEDRQVAFVLFDRPGPHPERIYLTVTLGGDNNVFNASGRRARDWSPLAVGCHWQVLSKIVERASACCGGCLKLHGYKTEPESYIKGWRKVLDEPLPMITPGFWFEAYIDFPAPAVDGKCIERRVDWGRVEEGVWDRAGNFIEFRRYAYKKCAKERAAPVRRAHYDMDLLRFVFDLNNPADCEFWLGYHDSHVWRSLQVHGPDTL
jgi:hypothetical protein